MMELKKLFALIVLILLVSILPVVVAQEPTPTATSEPRATDTLTVTPSATATTTATDTLTPTPNPSATATASPVPTATATTQTCGDYEVAESDISDTSGLVYAINQGNSAGLPYTICLRESVYTLTQIHNSASDGNNGLPKITGDITILGMGATGADILRDTTQGTANFRLFYVAANASLTLGNVDLIGGDASGQATWDGGAVLNFGTFTAQNGSDFANHVAADDGGAIRNEVGASISIDGSEFTANYAGDDGAAIDNWGTAMISNYSNFYNNTVGGDEGGAIDNHGPSLSISNSSFTSNKVLGVSGDGGAIANDTGMSLSITNSSFISNETTANGGAIANEGLLNIAAATFNGNKAGLEGGAIYNTGTETSSIANSTFTGNEILLNGDDAGAIDNHAHLIITNSNFDQNKNYGDDGGAIWNDTGVILEIYNSSFTNNATLGGAGSTGGAIHNFGQLTVTSSTFESNSSSATGGAIYAYTSDVSLIATEFRLNQATDRGGAIYLYDSTLSIASGSLFANNTATSHAGALFLGGSPTTVTITDSILENNRSNSGSGGAIYQINGVTVISNSEIRGNVASVDGGAVYNSGTLTINQGSILDSNQAADDGGAIYSSSSDTLVIEDSVLKYNTAVDDGGAVRNSSDVTTSSIHSSCIYGNSALDISGVYSSVAGFDATTNWWGDETGPGGAGLGSGDEVNANVLYNPFSLTDCALGEFDMVSADAIYVEDEPPVNLFISFAINDPNITSVSSVTITIKNLIDAANEILGLGVTDPNITATYLDGVLTLSGTETNPQNYAAVLASLSYINTSQDPDEATRDLEIVVFDSSGYKTHPGRVRVAVVSVPDLPALTLDNDNSAGNAPNFSTNYSEAQAPVLIVDGISIVDGTPLPTPDPSISDMDSENLVSLTANIFNPLDTFYEMLAVDSTVLSNYPITSVWAGDTLYLSGSASLADYKTVLDTLSYVNLSDTPDMTTARRIDVEAFDGAVKSYQVFATVGILNANTPPTVNLDTDNSERHSPNYETVFQIGGDPVKLSHIDATITDPEQTTLSGATIWIDTSPQAPLDPVNESLAVISNLNWSYDVNTGFLTSTDTALIGDYITAIRSLTYQNTASEPTMTERTIYIQVDDGQAEHNISTAVSSTVTFVGQFPSEVTCIDLRAGSQGWVDTSASPSITWDSSGMYSTATTGTVVSASYNIGLSGNYRVLVASSGTGTYELRYGSIVPSAGTSLPFTAISRSAEVYDIRDKVIQLQWTVDATSSLVFEHLCYTALPSELPDLTVTNVDVSGMVIDPITLEINGTVSATIDNIGTADAFEPFTILFYEDPDADGYDVDDPVLGSTTVDTLVINDLQIVNTSVSGTASFIDVPVYAFVDSDDVVIESFETNNTGWNLGECQLGTTQTFDLTNALEWQWSPDPAVDSYVQVVMAPAVADLNKDGIPDIVFSTFSGSNYNGNAVLRAISGDGTGELFTIDTTYKIDARTSIAIGNIDNDDELEIVTRTTDNKVIVFQYIASSPYFIKEYISSLSKGTRWTAPVIANLDGIGTPEIIVGSIVYNGDASFRWQGTGGYGAYGYSVVANIDNLGLPEVIAGNTAYRANGEVYWQNNAVPDGYATVANIDQTSPEPEIVVAGGGYVYLLTFDGHTIGDEFALGNAGSSVSIADVDNDGQLEIGVIGGNVFRLLTFDGTNLVQEWQTAPNVVYDNSPTSSNIFDFDGDGIFEIVYKDEQNLFIFNPINGQVLTSISSTSNTGHEQPVVVDVDADGHAEIIVVSNDYGFPNDPEKTTGIQVYGSDSWLPTRRIWNQYSYHITNVNDDGSIPTFEANNWDIYNNYRQNVYTAGCATGQPDLTASYPRSNEAGGQTDLTVHIGNGGSVYVPAGVSVSFYDGDPNYASSTLLGTTTTTKLLEVGDWEDVTIRVTGSLTVPAIWMVADDLGNTTGINGEYTELNETNNIVHLWNPSYYLADLTVNDVDTQLMSIDPNTLEISGTVTATIENIGVKSASETFTVLFYEDPDADGYDTNDPILGSTSYDGLAINDPQIVSASVSGTASFIDVPVYAFVDSDGVVAESNENNNTGWNLGECQLGATQTFDLTNALEWEWTSSTNYSSYVQVMMAPVVADLNKDSIPDIIFNSFAGSTHTSNGVLRAISGDGTGELFAIVSNTDYNIDPSSQIAVGDIDNDGELEIITVTTDNQIIIFQYVATSPYFIVEHKSTEVTANTVYGGAPMITNLDGVGTSEIIIGNTVYDSDAILQWRGDYGFGENFSVVANIDNLGLPEVIAGNTVYDADGNKVWQNTTVPDGFVGVGNIDPSSSEPEIVVSGGGKVYLLNYDGTIIGNAISLGNPIFTGHPRGGAPTIADIDNDGQLEIGIVDGSFYRVLGFDGTNLVEEWKTSTGTVYDGSADTGSSIFDFDGDGVSEIIYKDEDELFIFSPIYDPDNGHILTSIHSTSKTIHELPVIADVDADGHAEIIVVSNDYGFPNDPEKTTGIQVYGSDSWLPTRRIWNQHSYHITNVNEDGSIPTFEANNWDIYNNYRQNVYTAGCATGQPDLTASYARRTQLPATSEVQLTARIGNGGSVYVPTGVSVTFYDNDPQNGGNILGTTTTSQLLEPRQWEDVSIILADTTIATPLWVVADDTGDIATINIIDSEQDELNELNNVLASNVYVMFPPNDEPTATANTAATWDMNTQGNTMDLSGSVTDNIWPINSLTATWETITASYPVDIAQEVHVFSTQTTPPYDVSTTVTFDAGGTYTFRIRVTDGEFTRYSDSVSIAVIGPPVPPEPPLPDPDLHENTCIISPNHADTVTGLVNIDVLAGTNLVNASVFYWPAHDPQLWKTLSYNGTLYEGISITDTTEIIFDTTVIANDTYGVQIVGTNPGLDGIPFTEDDIRVVCGVGLIVTGEYKPGRVVLSTVDFTVPLAGLPITVGRTYDSLEREYEGDFGYGWTLTIGKPRLEVDDSNNVTLTMPDGTRKTFYWSPIPYFISYFGSKDYWEGFGENGEFTSNGCSFITMGSDICFPGFIGGLSYYKTSISQFTYEDPYGREFVYSKAGDLLSITDLNGNQITFDANGIYSSSGRSVNFIRDSQGRIEKAIAPDGATYTYVYDPQTGDLTTVKLPDPNDPMVADDLHPISYTYFSDPLAHFFKSGTDANGNRVAITTYYPDGRIETVTDAFDNVTTYTYDVSGHQTTVEVHDAGNNLLSHEETSYDAYGNVLTEKIFLDEAETETRVTRYAYNADNDPLYICDNSIAEAVPCDANNFTTKYSYDSDGNRTSVTNAEDIEVISASYNDYGGPTSLTDANGVKRTITYNAQAMPSTAIDVLGNIGSYTWTTQGSPDIVTDANGNPTNYDYDQYGNVEKVTDAQGIVTHYTYDNMGRRTNTCNALVPTGETCGDSTATTHTVYDALGRVTSVTEYDRDANGIYTTISQTAYEYDANGNRSKVIQGPNEVAPRITSYTYDFNNRVDIVTYPDGTFTDTDYDFRGNVTSQTDVRGVKTCYEYDLAGQLKEVRFACDTPDEVVTRYGYDAVGRRILSVEGDMSGDALYTHYFYDATGRIERMRITDSEVIDAQTTIFSDTCYGYDLAGQLKEVKAACGSADEAITSYEYDARGRRVQVTYPDGTWTFNEYDGVGRVTTSLDAAGTPTQYTYDMLGNLTQVVQGVNTPDAMTTRYVYDDLGRRIGVCDNTVSGTCDETSFTTAYTYNALEMIVTDAAGYPTTTKYNRFGEVIEQINARNFSTKYDYEYIDNEPDGIVDLYRVRVTSAEGLSLYQTSAETVYMGGQRILTTVAINNETQNGFKTTYDYDDNTGRLLGICDASVGGAPCDYLTNATTVYGYDLRGRQTSVTDANNHTTNYSYDPAGRLMGICDASVIGTCDALSYTSSYAYDALGRRISMSDAAGNLTQYGYDLMGRMTTMTDAAGGLTRYSYDDMGRQTIVCDPRVPTGVACDDSDTNLALLSYPFTKYEYNNLGWLKTVKNGEGNQVEYIYDNMGRVVEIRDGNYHPVFNPSVTSFEYDARGLLTQKQWPDYNYETYEYDENGNLASQKFYKEQGMTDYLEAHHIFEYDPLNRVSHATYLSGVSTDGDYYFTYNSRGQRAGVWASLPNPPINSPIHSYQYDVLGRPIQIDNETTDQTVIYGYDPVGNRTSIETQIGGIQQSQVSYGYDELNRLTSAKDINEPIPTTIGYNAIGQMTTLNRPNGINTIYSYNDPNPYVISDIEHKQGINLISGFHYEYDPAGNREMMSDLVSGVNINYYYDKANRLIEEQRNNNGVPSSTHYAYDANGNRVQEIRPNDYIYYTYNKNDQLTQIDKPDDVTYFNYDARGNLIETIFADAINPPIYTNYSYDARNQLINFNGQATFTYDHDGRRIAATAGVTTNYLWDEFSTYGDVVLETGTNGIRSYTLAAGMLLSQTDTAGTLYFLGDAQGSTRALTDDMGAITSSYDYDAFGNLQGSPTLETNYLYTGQQFDPISELYSLRARYYDASIGRFLSRDTWPYDYQNPVELNRYVYTANNPATMVDPTGYFGLRFAIGIGVAVTAVGILATNYAYQQGLSSYSNEYILQWDFGKAFNRLIDALLIKPFEFNRKIDSAIPSAMVAGSITIGLTIRLIGEEEDLQFIEKFPLYQETIDDFIETFPQVLDHWQDYIETFPLMQQSWQDFIETFPLMQELWEDFIETIPLEQQTVWDNVLAIKQAPQELDWYFDGDYANVEKGNESSPVKNYHSGGIYVKYHPSGDIDQLALYNYEGKVIYHIDSPEDPNYWHLHDFTDEPGNPAIDHGPDADHPQIGNGTLNDVLSYLEKHGVDLGILNLK